MDVSIAALAVAALAVVVGSTIQGAIGFGMNLVSVPVLALVAPETLPVAAILFGVPVSITMYVHERAFVDLAGVRWLVTGRVPGTIAGAAFVAAAGEESLRVAVGALVLVFALLSAVAPPIPVHAGTQALTGVIAGVTSTTAGIGGPPQALLYQRHTGPVIRSTLALTFLIGTALSMSALAIGGEVEWTAVAVGALLAPAVVLGTRVGRRFHDVLERGWLRPAVLAFAAVSGIVVLLDAL